VQLRSEYGDDSSVEAALQQWFSDLPKTHPSKKWSRYKHVDKHGPWRDDNISWPGGGGPRYDVIHPVTKKPCSVPERGWVFAKPETMEEMIEIGVVQFREDHTNPPIRKSHIRPIDFEVIGTFEDSDEAETDNGNEEQIEEELATQVRGSYFYKQAQVTAKYMRRLMGAKVFDNPKDHEELGRIIEYSTAGDPNAIVVDFFAGSGTTGHSVWELNVKSGGDRRFILVQLPEPLDPAKKDQKNAAAFCDKIGRPRNIAELTKERLRRAAKKIKEGNPDFHGDTGFRVFKLASSNIRAWEPETADLESSLLKSAEHLVQGRKEQDVLCELLLKLGLDLCVPLEVKTIAGKSVHSIGGGALMVCLADGLTKEVVEPLSAGIVAWRAALTPAVDTRVVFKDSGFVDDIAKTNMAAILSQNGISDVRSL
jgi:adenine-specific DNA-methyltransferase